MKLAERSQRNIAIVSVTIMFVLILTGCQFTGYKRENPESYTEAVYSLLGIKGYHSHGDSMINIIEEDPFGRILFSYYDESCYYYDDF